MRVQKSSEVSVCPSEVISGSAVTANIHDGIPESVQCLLEATASAGN